jgi:hypothetical protein
VVHPPGAAQGHGACAVNAVVADSDMRAGTALAWCGFGQQVIDNGGGAPVQ